MLMMLMGIAGTIAAIALWVLVKEYNWSKLGYAMSVFTLCVLFFVLAFMGSAYGEGAPGAALRAGISFLFLTTVLGIVSYRVLIGKLSFKKSAK